MRDLLIDPSPALPLVLAALVSEIEPPADAADSLRVALALHHQLLAPRTHKPLEVTRAHRADPSVTSHAGLPSSRGEGQGSHRPFRDSTWNFDPLGAGVVAAASHFSLPSVDDEARSVTASGPLSTPVDDNCPTTLGPATLASVPSSVAAVTRHDEWDYSKQVHLRHWATVQERHIQGTDMNFRADVLARFPSLARQVRRHLARVSTDAPRRQRRLRDGESIDTDAALEAFVDHEAGRLLSDDRLYQARPRRDRDVCVALLLDTSSSTGFVIPQGCRDDACAADADHFEVDDLIWQSSARHPRAPSKPQRRVIDVVKDAAVLLCEGLHGLDDRHAVFAFSGKGRHNVAVDVVKRFDEAWSARKAAAVAALQPVGATRTGAAVRHALTWMRAELARRKMLIIISDGYPQDEDYGSDPSDQQYGLLDTAHALREAERQGVVTFNISVDAAANDYLRRMCPKDRYMVIDEVDALPTKLIALLQRMAASLR